MIRFFAGLLFAAVSFSSAQAAIVVTSEDDGESGKQYYSDGEFVLMRGGQPEFGVDRKGNCWFVSDGQLVSDPCEQLLQSMTSMRDQAMAGMSARDRAMMEQMMGKGRAAPPVTVVRAGNKKIAGYDAACHSIGGTREICTSERLMNEIKREMGDSRFMEMFGKFGESANEMGAEDPQTKAVAKLTKNGFPLLDMQKVAAMPGMNAAMMNFLPEAQRAEIMKQMGAAAGGGQMQGMRVTKVERNGPKPSLDLSGYPRMGFQEFMQQQMGSMGAMPRRR